MNWRKKEIIFWGLLILIFAVFLAFRLPLANFIYHQDEYKLAEVTNPFFGLQGQSVQPPLSELALHYFGAAFGYQNLRWLILFFSVLCFFLVFKIAEEHYGKKSAFFAAALFAILPYSIIASIQIDIDGAILPFWILLAVWSFTKIDFFRLKQEKKSIFWLMIFSISLIGGLLSKLSFVLILPALAIYFLNHYREKINRRTLYLFAGLVVSIVIVLVAILFLISLFYHSLSPMRFISHAESFSLFNFGGRDYFQVLYLTAKAILLLSPFFLLFLCWRKKDFSRYQIWLWYAIFALIFYLVLFDFSRRTIDRYLMFLILPLVFVGGDIISRWLDSSWLKSYWAKIIGLVSFLSLAEIGFSILKRSPKVLPLIPKDAYLAQLKHLDFSFLLPFSSGSGPIGFYMSAKFIFIFWLICLVALVTSYIWKKQRNLLIMIFLAAIFVYALALNLELASGWFFGSPNKITKNLVERVLQDKNIPKVITYNDTGTYELSLAGKYQGRFYVHPEFYKTNQQKFKDYKGDFLVIDFPKINEDSVYWQYFKTCTQDYKTTDGLIDGYIFDCQKGDRALFDQ